MKSQVKVTGPLSLPVDTEFADLEPWEFFILANSRVIMQKLLGEEARAVICDGTCSVGAFELPPEQIVHRVDVDMVWRLTPVEAPVSAKSKKK